MKKTVPLILLTLAALGAHSSELFKGENLLAPPPTDDDYEALTMSERGLKSMLWQSRTHEFGDHYVVNILSRRSPNLAKFRESQDEPGRAACSSFSSETLGTQERNGYPSLMWATECTVGEMNIRSIQLAIAGRDSLYHVRKLWKIPVSGEIYDSWRTRIEEISVCDTRRKKHPCPENLKKVQES